MRYTLWLTGSGAMQIVRLIEKKRDGDVLSNEEIRWFITELTANRLPDYQVSALLMAIYFQGMNPVEIVTLTLAMAESGQQMDLSDITDYAVDKHSSGGVGDKTTLVVLPLVASCGIRVAKMSGRGLGFSGGTLDKLESIPGFNVNLSDEQFRDVAKRVGVVLCGQTGDLAPADGKLYAMRDVTGTVPSIPLIASSIMSKKLASGARGMVLDVKWGNGAFMTTLEQATALAQQMAQIGADAGRDVICFLSDMNQPLGYAVGNALEVREAIECLSGSGPSDLREHCLAVGAAMLELAGRGKEWTDRDATRAFLEAQLDNGAALAKWREMVIAQGGDVRVVDNPDTLAMARYTTTLTAQTSGNIQTASALEIARATLVLGAGREKKGDAIDHAVGVVVPIKVGQTVNVGDTLAVVHANDEAKLAEAAVLVRSAIFITNEFVQPLPLFYGEITQKAL